MHKEIHGPLINFILFEKNKGYLYFIYRYCKI